jgi:mannose-6-phosphate isomerase-like protein (cupin superfamily)
MQKAKRQNYIINKDNLPVRTAAPKAAAHKGIVMSTQRIHGIDNSIMFAERGAGYHTTPHMHECEQINYVVEGEIWFFVEGQGYQCKKGDLMRIPRNRIHWAFNCSDQQATVIESHSPCLIGNDAEARKLAVSLLGDDERMSDVRTTVNVVVDVDPQWVADCEREAIGDAVLKWPVAERRKAS